jgi:hypothetical protein
MVLSCYFQKFHKSLTPFPVKTYSLYARQKSQIFDTDMQVVGNYGGLVFCPRKEYVYVVKKLGETRSPSF